MKILMVSHAFHPSVGGLESVSRMLAEGFVRHGHEVVLVTQTPSDEECEYGFDVVRRPGAVQLLRLLRWSDVFFHNNISLQLVWPLLLVRRPWVVAHHTWMARGTGLRKLKGLAKLFSLRFASCISISHAIAGQAAVPSRVIPNPYDETAFYLGDERQRDRDLVFVGRMVSDKGGDLLVEALAQLKSDGLRPSLTMIGDGPERAGLEAMVEQRGLTDLVRFLGFQDKTAVAAELNRHRILVVPSRWNEPFGIVALEGIACGCVVAASSGGGLADAVGGCGVIFNNGDLAGLVEALRTLLQEPDTLAEYRAAAPEHLARHREDRVVGQYIEVLASA